MKFLSTIDLTTFPLTSASQILIYVRNTNKNVRTTRYLTSLPWIVGIATLTNYFIFLINSASTFPPDFFINKVKNIIKHIKLSTMVYYKHTWTFIFIFIIFTKPFAVISFHSNDSLPNSTTHKCSKPKRIPYCVL